VSGEALDDAVQHAQDFRAHRGVQRLEFSQHVFAVLVHHASVHEKDHQLNSAVSGLR
jgi:hypothetical protein